MQKFLFDKEIVNNQLSVLNNTLASQRQTKKTLLSYLEKFSDAMYENFNSDNTDSLLSLINEAHSIFECIKSNIKKTIELKKFLENIYNSDFLNTIDSEKFNNDFNNLLENISKTNSNYLTFMNNYENFIKPFPTAETNSLKIEESPEDYSSKTEIVVDSQESEEESLFETINQPDNSIKEVSEEEVSDGVITINEKENIEETTTTVENKIEENIITEPILEEKQEETTSVETVVESIKEIEEINETNKSTKKSKDFTIIDDSEEEPVEDTLPSIDLQEKELIIKKSLGIAILPYSISDLDELFLDDPEKYSSIQDIIDQEYTVNLKDFENSSITRYKEAFKLAKDKSNYTFSQAVNFAKKLLVENEVTSLIIASCKSVEELEFYIECLNNNKLDDFHHFKIIEE